MKTLIQDSLTNQFYCVEQTEPTKDGGFTAGPNDFPFWSNDIDKAYDFGSELFAKNEMAMNDLTCDGSRKPEIVNSKGQILHEGYKITYNENKSKYIARNGRKIFSSNSDLKILKSSIDAWNRNCELSDSISTTLEGRSSNPNVVRSYEKDNRGGY